MGFHFILTTSCKRSRTQSAVWFIPDDARLWSPPNKLNKLLNHSLALSEPDPTHTQIYVIHCSSGLGGLTVLNHRLLRHCSYQPFLAWPENKVLQQLLSILYVHWAQKANKRSPANVCLLCVASRAQRVFIAFTYLLINLAREHVHGRDAWLLVYVCVPMPSLQADVAEGLRWRSIGF